MKTVTCKSGRQGWQSRLQKIYRNFKEFAAYCRVYNNHRILGFPSMKKAWEANPLVQGSVLPADYCRVIDGFIKPATKLFFEYHCYESHDSHDAELWYHSHQRVTVGKCVNAKEYGDLSSNDRGELGHPLVYNIKFEDGFEGQAFEDELLYRKSNYCRPDPPQPRRAYTCPTPSKNSATG